MNLALIKGPAPSTALRLFRIVGDCCEPQLRGGDFLMVAPADRFSYDSEYLLDFGDGEAPYVASRRAGGVSVRHRNPRYSLSDLTTEAFNRAVTGIVVADVKVRDEGLIQGVYAQRVAA
jgi:hypothetical protein